VIKKKKKEKEQRECIPLMAGRRAGVERKEKSIPYISLGGLEEEMNIGSDQIRNGNEGFRLSLQHLTPCAYCESVPLFMNSLLNEKNGSKVIIGVRQEDTLASQGKRGVEAPAFTLTDKANRERNKTRRDKDCSPQGCGEEYGKKLLKKKAEKKNKSEKKKELGLL